MLQKMPGISSTRQNKSLLSIYFFLFISRERTRNFASNVLGLTREKCMDVEKMGGEKNFFSCWVSRQEVHNGALTGCVLGPEKIIT